MVRLCEEEKAKSSGMLWELGGVSRRRNLERGLLVTQGYEVTLSHLYIPNESGFAVPFRKTF